MNRSGRHRVANCSHRKSRWILCITPTPLRISRNYNMFLLFIDQGGRVARLARTLRSPFTVGSRKEQAGYLTCLLCSCLASSLFSCSVSLALVCVCVFLYEVIIVLNVHISRASIRWFNCFFVSKPLHHMEDVMSLSTFMSAGLLSACLSLLHERYSRDTNWKNLPSRQRVSINWCPGIIKLACHSNRVATWLPVSRQIVIIARGTSPLTFRLHLQYSRLHLHLRPGD